MAYKRTLKIGTRRRLSQVRPDLRISLKHFAKFFNCQAEDLAFAVAETYDGDGGFEAVPVLIIKGSDNYIDLKNGVLLKTSYASNVKQNFFRAIVGYENDNFVFSAPMTEACISKKALIEQFGQSSVY